MMAYGLLLAVTAVIGAVPAIVHVAVAGAHYRQFWGFGVFLLGAGWLQLIWAIGLIGWPTRLWLLFGAALNTIVVAVYVVTRTVGEVIGPTPDAVEPVGFGDALCTACEIAVIVSAVVLLLARLDRPMARSSVAGVITVICVAAIIVASIAALASGA